MGAKNLDSSLSPVLLYLHSYTCGEPRDMDPKEGHKDPKIFDMIVIVGLIFNALIAIFLVLYWLNLL